ncbi:MAG: DUF4186 family protein [Thaumarchaeota archaeon]|nr:DUF4186 family protein [Nitrososphaerota archaeon]
MASNYTDDWKKRPEPIKKKVIMCGETRCEEGRHSFKTNMRKKAARLEKKTYRNGSCICCNEEFDIDWKRIDNRDLGDVKYLVSKLKLEAVRYDFWEIPVEEKDFDTAKKKGLLLLRKEIRKRVEKALAPPSHKIYQDGRQTPKSGNIIYYAQYAMATCCRKCVEEWHGIDRKKQLKKKDIEYISGLILYYIKKRFPTIKEEGLLEEPIIKR